MLRHTILDSLWKFPRSFFSDCCLSTLNGFVTNSIEIDFSKFENFFSKLIENCFKNFLAFLVIILVISQVRIHMDVLSQMFFVYSLGRSPKSFSFFHSYGNIVGNSVEDDFFFCLGITLRFLSAYLYLLAFFEKNRCALKCS